MADMSDEGGALPAGLSTSDINTTINGEPRVHDLRLAAVLKFKRPRAIRELIERYLEALERLGGICRTVRQNQGRGRPPAEYWLTKKQAVFLSIKAETEQATEVAIQVVEVFDAATAPAPAPSLPAAPMAAEPPFCRQCAAKLWWNLGGINQTDHPLRTRPLDHTDLQLLRIIRERIDHEVGERLAERMKEAMAAAMDVLNRANTTGGGDA